jgi:hypothetical protein
MLSLKLKQDGPNKTQFIEPSKRQIKRNKAKALPGQGASHQTFTRSARSDIRKNNVPVHRTENNKGKTVKTRQIKGGDKKLWKESPTKERILKFDKENGICLDDLP